MSDVGMAPGQESGRSRELDEVRRMLFPTLSPEDGWARIDWAFRAASDPERRARFDEMAAEPGLYAELLGRLRQLLDELFGHSAS